jgi:hypothetical protein
VKLDTRHEPVRLAALLAGGITSTGTLLVHLASAADWRLALGTALLNLGVVVGGGELARRDAVSPATHDLEVALAEHRGRP